MDRATRLPFNQTEVAEALVKLTREDAPTPTWFVNDTGPQLIGTLYLETGTDTDRRNGLLAWQRVIGAGPVHTETRDSKTRLTVTGSYEGVPVRVSTSVRSEEHCECCPVGAAA